MDDVSRLSRELKVVNEVTLQGLSFDHHPIKQEDNQLKLWLSHSDHWHLPPISFIRRAVARFRASGQVDFRDAWLVCYGVSESLPLNGKDYCLLDDNEKFLKLLKKVDCYRSQSRRYRRCYRGLLSGYLSRYPGPLSFKGSVVDSWENLRCYLSDHIEDIHMKGVVPYWVSAICAHRNLLTSDPFSRYVQEVLDGTGNTLGGVEQSLGLSESSWVIEAMVQSCIVAVVSLPDERFNDCASSLARLLRRYRRAAFFDQNLVKLLDRCCQTRLPVPYSELCDLAIEHWGNPWFDVNRYHWSLVSSTTYGFVREWLKLNLISSFFDLFATEGNDGRLKFWTRYLGRMVDVYFILGYYAMYHESHSFSSLRSKAAGRLLRLSAADRESNALVMVMGGYAFIEFGKSGGALYIHQGLPFDPDSIREVDVSLLVNAKWSLARQDCANGYGRWEQYFDAYLYQNFRVRASDDELPEPWRSGLYLAVLNGDTLQAFCQAFCLEICDERQQSGCLWVLAGYRDAIVCEQLRAWGFSYHVGRGWCWGQSVSGSVV